MSQQLRDWAKQALEMLNDNHHLVADNEKHAYVMLHLEVIEKGKALLEQPEPSVTVRYDLSAADTEAAIRDKLIELGWTPPAQPADHDVEKAVAYLDGVHTGKQIAKREWVGLTAKDLSEIPANCYEGAIWADAKLKEKNT